MPFVSILNDVLGPIMRGPSSSHTAGAYRIARLSKDIFGVRPATVVVTFDPDGSMAPTYKPLGVDLAFAAALVGWDMTDDRYPSSPGVLAEDGTKLEFRCAPLRDEEHPNAMRISMADDAGSEAVLYAKSTGGGVVDTGRGLSFTFASPPALKETGRRSGAARTDYVNCCEYPSWVIQRGIQKSVLKFTRSSSMPRFRSARWP